MNLDVDTTIYKSYEIRLVETDEFPFHVYPLGRRLRKGEVIFTAMTVAEAKSIIDELDNVEAWKRDKGYE